MKKILLLIVAMLILATGCSRSYHCQLDYEIIYPDTIFVRHYEFEGDSWATYHIEDHDPNGKVLYIFPTRAAFGYDIARVTSNECDIIITDFKVYKYGIDIEE